MAVDLNKLNEEQKEAVSHGEGPLLIVAGAGTGKTTVITQRIANLIEKGLAKPEEILALTFTEKAAGEMEERIDSLLTYGYIDLWVSTFHAYCERILRDHALDIGLSPDFKIVDSTSIWLMARKNLDSFKLDYYRPLGNPTKFITSLISHFSHCKDQEIYPEEYLEYADKLKTSLDESPEKQEIERIKEVANAYHAYQKMLLENNSLDFGDLINYCLKLFKTRPLILKKYREKFKYILVDEFQDTNWAQYELIKLLSAPKNNLTVCADDDQCLPKGTLIETEKGSQKIENLKAGEKVLTALGRGHIGVSKINKIFKNKKQAKILSIKTRSGFFVKATDNHKFFCHTARTFDKGYHYVYLMHRQDVGWRIGVTNDLIIRLRLERSADKILAVKKFDTDAQARYHETLWSLKYGIPTNCFMGRKRVVIKDNLLINLYKELDVDGNVKKFADDLNIDLDSPHFCLDAVNRGNKVRIIINLKMCYRNYRSKDNVKTNKPLLLRSAVTHQLSVETSCEKIIKILEQEGCRMKKAKKGMKFQCENDNLAELGKLAKRLQEITGGIIEPKFNLGLKYDKFEKKWRSYYASIMPAKNLVIGNYLPVKKGRNVIYDEIIEIKQEDVREVVYDLEIDKTHNFFANGIAVHNSIYKFRGASFSNIVQFSKDFPDAKNIPLVKNYRSAQNILDLSYKFIKANDPDRLEFVSKINKKLISGIEGQGTIERIHEPTLEREAKKTIEKIQEILKKDKKATYNDFAILSRSNDAAIPFIKALERAGLPYQFLASRGLYGKSVILDIISYFKLLDNYHESLAFYRVLNFSVFDIPADDLMRIIRYSHMKTKSLYEAANDLAIIPNVSDKTKDKLLEILGIIKRHTSISRERPVSEVLLSFLNDTGYLKQLAKKDDEEDIGHLNQFYKRIKKFEETSPDNRLNVFMAELLMEIESGEMGKLEFDPDAGPDMIKIMTVHGAKGLEFKYVFLVNMVDKRFPAVERKDPIEIPEDLIKDIKPKGDAHLGEERRICYVGMTRAKRGLYFTSADDYGGSRKKKISRFLAEMGYKDESEIYGKSSDGLSDEKAIKPKARKKEEIKLPEHFSYSQLAAYLKCPMQYKLGFLLKIPIKGKPVFSFGKTMHETLHMFLKNASENNGAQKKLFENNKKEKNNSGFENLLKIYERCWKDEWYESKSQKEDYFKLGKKILKNFYSEFEKNTPKILKINNEPALELPFKLKIGNYSIFGVIDRIDETSDGPMIIDYKTGSAKEKLDADAKMQLLIYQIAAEEILKIKPNKLAYHYLDENIKTSFIGSEKEKEELKEKIKKEISEIEKSDFAATPGWQCGFCDFKDICDFSQK